MYEYGVVEGTENAPPGRAYVEYEGRWFVPLHPDVLWSIAEEAKKPFTQGAAKNEVA